MLPAHRHGTGVATEVIVGLEDVHLMISGQIPGGGKAADTGADDGNTLTHACSFLLVGLWGPSSYWALAALKASVTRSRTPAWGTTGGG